MPVVETRCLSSLYTSLPSKRSCLSHSNLVPTWNLSPYFMQTSSFKWRGYIAASLDCTSSMLDKPRGWACLQRRPFPHRSLSLGGSKEARSDQSQIHFQAVGNLLFLGINSQPNILTVQ
ncbi:unnamed protein product [Protopolystoma xenopodis]|uniref:Uncharacterized protein n=1 Tax=Protopolystoma xenopodis TaxID=117903 RepID=A0A3S5BK31_9PLAT|nr:unnamed protein product [Protopolystoma xenopodis]